VGAGVGLVVPAVGGRAFGVALRRVVGRGDLGYGWDNSGLGSLLDHCNEEVAMLRRMDRQCSFRILYSVVAGKVSRRNQMSGRGRNLH